MHRREHGRVAVSEVRRDEPGREVHVTPTIGIVQIHAFAPDDGRRLKVGLRGPRREHETTMVERDIARRGRSGRKSHERCGSERPPGPPSAKTKFYAGEKPRAGNSGLR